MKIEDRQRLLYIVADFLSTNVAVLLFNILRFSLLEAGGEGRFHSLPAYLGSRPLVLEQALFPLLMMMVYMLAGCYNSGFLKSRLRETLSTAVTAAIGTLLLFFGVLINDISTHRMLGYELLIVLWALLFGVVYIPRLCITMVSIRNVRSGRWCFNTLIVGVSQGALNYERRLRSPSTRMGLRVVGFVATEPFEGDRADYPAPVYDMADIERAIEELKVNTLVVVPHRNGMHATTDLINRLFALDKHLYITSDVFQLMTSRPRMHNVASELLVDITSPHLSPSAANLKRLGDIVISAFTLVAIAPMMAVLAILIKRDSPGPVFYKQERIGYHKQPFYIYKLRTMRTDAEAAGPALSTVDDPRITPLGRILRKYRLDEFPQFWNVLKGDMSIVGPRPERRYYISRIVERVPHYVLIHQVRPGITSWGMVKYGYASTVDQMIERLSYDLLYIENVSFSIDMKIIIYTVKTVLTGKGI